MGRGLFFLVFVGFPVVLSGEEAFFLAFVAFGSFGTGEGLLWYAAHFQGHSVRRTAFSGTGVIFGTGNPLLWYAMHFQGLPGTQQPPVVRGAFSGALGAKKRLLVRKGYSVRRTGFSGTGVILNCCKGSTNREKYKK